MDARTPSYRLNLMGYHSSQPESALSIPPDKRHHLATDSAKQRKSKEKEEIQKRRGKRVRWSVPLIACTTERGPYTAIEAYLQIKRPIEEEKQQREAINGNNAEQMQPCA
jgi:hypothetical protein